MKTGTMMKRFVKACSGVTALMVSAVLFCGLVGNAVAANGTPYYLDVNGAAPGFGDPSGTINATDAVWSTDPTGQTTPAAFVAGGQLTFGYPGTTGVSNQTFSVSVTTSFNGMDVKVPCTITVTALPNGVAGQTFTWTVVNGATLNVNGNCNYNNMGVTLQGDGIINFNTSYLGFNVIATSPWTQNMSGGTVRLLSTCASPTENQASYTLTAGTLNFANAASAGAFSGLGIGNYTTGGKTLSFNGGTVDNTSGSAMTLNIKSGTYVFGGNFIFAGSSSLNLNTNTVNLGTTTPTVTVSANTLTIGGSITNTAGLTKAGAGMLALTANNTYSGATTVNNGAMTVVTGGSCSNSAVTVYATSGNTAMLNISVTDTTKQWTCSSLTVNNAGTSSGLQFAFGSMTPSTTLAPLRASGSVTFSTAPAITVSGISLPLSSGNGYPLVTWGSGSAPSLTGVTLTLPLRVVGNLAVVGSTLYLQITGNTGPLAWTGGDGTWDINNSGNATIWKDNTSANTYYQEGVSMDSVLFDSTIGSGGTVTLNTNVSPTSVTVNSLSNYTFGGSGGIAGTAGLTKSGTGTLMLNTKNSYSGATTINAGTLLIAVGNSCSNSAVSVAATAGNTATLSVAVTNTTKQWACSALTVNNAGDGSVLDFNFGALTPSTTVAPLKIAGTMAFTTVPTVKVEMGDVGVAGTQYPLITWSSGSVIAPSSVTVTINSPRGFTASLRVTGTTLYLVIDAANGTPYFLDVNGATPGFGDPVTNTSYAYSGNYWTTNSAGTDTPTTAPDSAQYTFGYPGTAGISNSVFSFTGTSNLKGIVVNVPCTVSLSSFGTGANADVVWSVVKDATLNINGTDMNYNQTRPVMLGEGTINVIGNSFGRNGVDTTWYVQNMVNGVVNLKSAYTAWTVPQAMYKLQAGTLNFANAVSAAAFAGSTNDIQRNRVLAVYGGTLDNTYGLALTLDLGNARYEIGGSFTFAGTSSLNLNTNAVNLKAGTQTITVSANTLTIGGAITNSGAIVKAGAGTLALSANNTYSGATTINAGTMQTGVTGGCSNSAVTVAATSGNTATLNISVTDTTKQWTCSSLTVNNAGTSSGLQFVFGATTPSTTIAPLKASGSVTFSSASSITVLGASLPLSSGNGYPLVTWGSGSAPSLTGVTLTLPLRMSGNLAVVGSTLYLQITGNTGPLAWTGGDGTWDINNSGNATIWKDNVGINTYYQENPVSDSVLFDSTIGSGGTVTLNTNVSPTSVTVNSLSNYTFSGSGGIAGSAGLTKSGIGTLTLGTRNTYSGATTINAGTLLIAVGNSCSNSAVSVAATAGNTATLSLSVTNTTKQWACSALTVNNAGVGSVLDFNFGALTPSTSLAPLKIAGAVTFTTLPAITVTLGGVGAAGTTYPLMTWGSGSVAVPTNLIVNAPRGLVTHLTVSSTTLNLVVDVVNGTPYYLDVNGTTAGFGDLNGTTNETSTVWTTDVLGSGTPVAFPGDAQFAFGYPSTTGIYNTTNNINLDGSQWRGVSVNVPCSVTLSGSGGFLNGAQTWYVVAGATLIESIQTPFVGYGGLNWNGTPVTFQGGGMIQFNTSPGFNAAAITITQNMLPSGKVNFMREWTGTASYGPLQSSYTLQNGILNFATSASAGAFQGMRVGNLFTINGGTLDNTSGAPITLVSSNNSCRIGGSFTFAGSSSMSLGTNSVNLGTVTPTITVNANTFTIGGTITNIAGLAKAGAGTLVLSGNNNYSGGTTVSGGTLLVEGVITGAVNVVGGLLGGSGTVGGVVTNAAAITAADTNSIGTLTTAGLVMQENSTCVWNYNDTTRDVIQVNGSLTLPAVATVSVSRVTSGNLPLRGVLFNGFSSIVTNVGTLSGWVITGAAPRTYAEVQGDQVVLVTRPIGTLLRIF